MICSSLSSFCLLSSSPCQFERFINNSFEILSRLDELFDLMSQSRVADDLSAAETMLRRHQTQHDDISETPAGVLKQGWSCAFEASTAKGGSGGTLLTGRVIPGLESF